MEAVIEKTELADERLSAFAQNPLRPLIEKMAVRIAEEYQPEQIILYGSQATGRARPDSDIDLFVVKQADESFITRCVAIKRIVRNLRSEASVSPIVFTPAEVRKRLSRGDQFIRQIFEQGIHLYHGPDFWSGDLNLAIKSDDSLYPLDWLQFAERDWQRIEKRLEEDDHEDAAIHLQQALEKYLKAFLLANGWELKKTHEISKLLKEAIKYKSELNVFTDLCAQIEAYYFAESYPLSLDAGTPPEKIVKSFQEAHQLRGMILATFEKKAESTEQQDQSGKKANRKPRQAKTKRIQKNRSK